MFVHGIPTPQVFNDRGYQNLDVICRTRRSPDGRRFEVDCSGVPEESLTVKNEHILWIQPPNITTTPIDVQIPNYKIEDTILAAFKNFIVQSPSINLLLKPPKYSVEAGVGEINTTLTRPEVRLKYEPVRNTVVHYPNDRPYIPINGPILPPGSEYRSPVSPAKPQIDIRVGGAQTNQPQQQQQGQFGQFGGNVQFNANARSRRFLQGA